MIVKKIYALWGKKIDLKLKIKKLVKKFVFALIFASQRPNLTTERQKLRPFVSKYPPRFPTLKAVFRSFYRPGVSVYHLHETLLLQSRNPLSTNTLAH